MGGAITEGYCMNMISMDSHQLMSTSPCSLCRAHCNNSCCVPVISSFWTLLCTCPWTLMIGSALLIWRLGESALVGVGLLVIASFFAER